MERGGGEECRKRAYEMRGEERRGEERREEERKRETPHESASPPQCQ